MSGKGDTPRPFAVDAETFDINWEAIFGKKQVGLGRVVQASGSNPDYVGSSPTAPAIYIDPVTGAQVDEHWWPGDPVEHEVS